MSRFFAAVVLATIPTIAAAEQILPEGQNWLAVASTKDLDTAIGIAEYYAWQKSRVMTSKNGWYAIVLGPYEAMTISDIKAENFDASDLPKDALLSRGANYLDVVWQAPDNPAGPLQSYAPGKPARFSSGELVVEIVLNGSQEQPGSTGMTGRLSGQEVFSFETDSEYGVDGAEAALLELDPSNGFPELVVTRYSGGAHCCTDTWFISHTNGAWVIDQGATLDGAGYGYRDLDDDGVLELVAKDNAYLYAFGPYSESFPPRRYFKMQGGALKEVRDGDLFVRLTRRDLALKEFAAKIYPDTWQSNGFLASWVGLKATLGEGEDAWAKMLKNYQEETDFGPDECSSGEALDKCPPENVRKVPFPRALARFLQEQGYAELPDAALNLLK